MSELKYWVWLSSLKGIGSRTIPKLLEAGRTPKDLFLADRDTCLKWGIAPKEAQLLENKKLADAIKTIDTCAELGFRVLTLADAEYPDRLKQIYDPPAVLYIRGNLPAVDEEVPVAVAGTRRCSPYGLRMAEKLGRELAQEGCLLLSGLAKGIDTASAKGSLDAGGIVVGVIGSGPDVVYPAQNKRLFEEVAASGAVISEYPPGTEPSSWHFPARNRILSGLSVGVVILEAPEKSGALITAARALEQGRDVFVVPGNVDSDASSGSNRLLRAGAIPVLSGADVADEYRAVYPDRLSPEAVAEKKKPQKQVDKKKSVDYDKISQPVALRPQLQGDEKLVYSLLTAEARHVNDLIEQSGLPGARVLAALTMLEIKCLIRQEAGKHFSLRTV